MLRLAAVPGTMPAAYNAKHRELVANLDAAGGHITLGTAELVPLANLQYERAQFQARARDAVAAAQAGDRPRALALQKQAHQVMAAQLGLQDQAGGFDKANTYALNQSYGEHTRDSVGRRRALVVAGGGLLVLLLLVQLALAVSFRRVASVGLALATLVAAGLLFRAADRIDTSARHLTDARELAFDPVHELWQARAAVYAARQAEAQALLDPAGAAEWERQFRSAAALLYRLPDGAAPATVAARAGKAEAPDGSGGYLARALTERSGSPEAIAANGRALAEFGAFLDAHDRTAGDGRPLTPDQAGARFAGAGRDFTELVAAIDATLRLDEDAFATDAGAAADALDGLQAIDLAGTVVVAALALWSLSRRHEEYRPT
jgi:hypothetical protein